MTVDEIRSLAGGLLREAVIKNIDRDPFEVALDKTVTDARLVASQIKYLQKARHKLPSYYQAGCVIPPLAFEQSSGEKAAAHKTYSGKLCIDLTCGLGVDSFYLSKRFERVISVERDPVLAEIARVNFRLLGAENIEVVNDDAESFISERTGMKVDMIYVDPDRRNTAGRKLVLLEDCSPNIIGLMPLLKQIASKIVVKLSPMFDVDEVFRIFGTNVMVEAVSVDGECKEVLAEIDDSISEPFIKASSAGHFSIEYPYVQRSEEIQTKRYVQPEDFKYLIVPDVALVKARLAKRYFSEMGMYIETDSSFAFADELPLAVFGKVYKIISTRRYSPKDIRKEFKAKGVTRLNILKKNFPKSVQEIARSLSIEEGGSEFAAFTKFEGELRMFILRQL